MYINKSTSSCGGSFQHTHDAYGVKAGTSKKEGFGAWMAPCDNWQSVVAVTASQAVEAFVPSGRRYRQQGWIAEERLVFC